MKGELIPTMMYAEGRPRDVGTDRALANALNQFVDRKSAHQSPWLINGAFVGFNGVMVHIRPVFFGTEHQSATVSRTLTVAPWIRSNDGSLATFTGTLSELMPVYGPGKDNSSDPFNPKFPGKYSQATWTTSSTTWGTGADATLDLGVKQLEFGFAFLVLVARTLDVHGEFRGFAKCIEGVRVVT
jgi:hypothetical protein